MFSPVQNLNPVRLAHAKSVCDRLKKRKLPGALRGRAFAGDECRN